MSKLPPFDRALLTDRLNKGLSWFELPVEPDWLAEKLLDYLAELYKWNRAYNLTAVRDPAQMLPRHIYDSLSVLPWVQGDDIADAGTGAGLPGIPLALCHPQRRFTLLDSNGKKTRFVQHAVAHLGLDNVNVVQTRVADFQPERPVDTVFSRAFASLTDFVAGCGQMLAPEGRLVALKGRYPQQELEELQALRPEWQLLQSERLQVPGLDGERHVVVLANVI